MQELIHGDTPVPDAGPPHPAVQLFLASMEIYKRVFAGPLAPVLSPPRPVRRTGFDLDLVVAQRRTEARDVVALTLAAPDGRELPRWQPGAHLDVFLPSGRQRQYSLCGDPRDTGSYRIAVRRIPDGGGGSREVHDALHAGDPLRVRGPRNAFRLVAARSYEFVACGIGITPILPMVQAAARRGVPWRLTYLGRSRATMPFLDELAECTSGQVRIRPDDECGVPDIAALLARVRPDVASYVCGPPPVLDVARRTLTSTAGPHELHTERFSAPPVVGGRAFPVELARTGRVVEVGAGESVLAAVRRALPGVAYSCQQGFCGSCRTTVLAGEVEHHGGAPAGQHPDASMLLCVSRAAGDRLVLDL